MEVILDVENAVAGRAASIAAKEIMKGNKVFIVNAEKALVTGDQKYSITLYREKVSRGDRYNGPFYPRSPDRILKRMVRGMIPRRKPIGREAWKNLRVYISVPEELSGKDFRSLKGDVQGKAITLEKLSKEIGWRKHAQ